MPSRRCSGGDPVGLDQRAADEEVVGDGAKHTAHDGTKHRRQPGIGAIGQAVVLKPARVSKRRGPRSRAGLMAYPFMPPNEMPMATTMRPMTTGARLEPGRALSLSTTARIRPSSSAVPMTWSNEARPESGHGGEGAEDPPRVVGEAGIDLLNTWRRSRAKTRAAPSERAQELRDEIVEHLRPGHAPRDGHGQRHGGIQMRAADRAGNVDAEGDGESPPEGDVGVAALDDFTGNGRIAPEERDHGDRRRNRTESGPSCRKTRP